MSTPAPVARYRVHLIINANELPVPRSFRTEAYARSHDEAFTAAEWWLKRQPLTQLSFERMSSELVPDDPR